MVLMNRTCYKLYAQGPCAEGEWLVARRQPRGDDDGGSSWKDEKPPLPRARCECRPGYSRVSDVESNNVMVGGGKCQAPAVGLAKFLNENVKARNF